MHDRVNSPTALPPWTAKGSPSPGCGNAGNAMVQVMWKGPTIDYAPTWAFRHAAGGMPTIRRNARENAASES